MMRLPSELADYLAEYSLQARNPAYLVVGKNERLEDFRGELALYGIGAVETGSPFSIRSPS
jgi:hypothetical protein